ncbi:MAG: tyrosinase [Cyanobacteriota bacterium]|jgi:tyrosinase
MSTAGACRVRRSLSDLQADYDAGKTEPLDTLMRAWRGIKALPPTDPQSFFMLGGFHGEPFRGPGSTNSAWWGGYCQHGTVLFPTWHRVYLVKLEDALRSIPGCESVTLPFWDECSLQSQQNGIPRALTDEMWLLDGEWIDNPLRSFVLPMAIQDNLASDDGSNPDSPNYSKPAGYETVRYPLSGLVGTEKDQQNTLDHNAGFPNYAANVKTLDANIMAWLTMPVVSGGKTRGLVVDRFIACLDAPNYTLFSNTTSQKAWNKAHPHGVRPVVSIEDPHNFMHLAVGGYDVPAYNASPIAGANGDMGENDTAALDPIFYFHHCFIDYTFWIWQQRHGCTQHFTMDPQDPGSYYDSNTAPPPAGANLGDQLSMSTPLLPFTRADGSSYASRDCIDIVSQLGYSYGPGSLDDYAQQSAAPPTASASAHRQSLLVSGLDRSRIPGSFIIAAYASSREGRHELIGVDAVLSRWTVQGCANCQSHLRAGSVFPLPPDLAAEAVKVVVHTRHGAAVHQPQATGSQPGEAAQSPSMVSAGQLHASSEPLALAFHVEII